MFVSEIMTETPMSAKTDWTVRRALRTMYEEDFRHLPVIGEAGELLGIVSDRDLQAYMAPMFMSEDGEVTIDSLDETLGDVMSGDVRTLYPTSEISEAIALMLDHRIGAIPVVDASTGDLRGILSYIDVLRAAQDQF